jgi:catechol 2,3-dioxygenase-like lactoylglutathione lyase family enzyme
MGFKVAVVTLWAEDVPHAAHFYRDVVGLPLASHHGGMPHFNLGEAILVIAQGKPQAAQNSVPENFPLLGLSVPDFDQAVNRLRQHQVETPGGVIQGDGARWVLFHDPAGNLVELTEFTPTEKA